MEQYTDAMQMIDLMVRPAFCVRDGIIIKVNDDASRLLIETGTPVSTYLQTGAEEYDAFRGGCLYVNLSVCGQSLGFSVIRQTDFDLFRLEQDTDSPEFRAMALAARELRESLSSVMTITEQLNTDPEQAGQLNRRLYQMLRVIRNMSDAHQYAEAVPGPQELRDICAVIREIFDKAAALAEHTGVRLTYNGHPEPVYCLTDSRKLENAIHNILSNALKFTPAGGTIDAKLTRRGSKLYLSVHDSGCGIRDSVRGNLFSRYNRQPGIEDGLYGMGLGMVLIRSAAAIHGGTVLVDHPADTGTRVTMTIVIRQNTAGLVRSPMTGVAFGEEQDSALVALADVLPSELYGPSYQD